jgi:hypothetical protein
MSEREILRRKGGMEVQRDHSRRPLNSPKSDSGRGRGQDHLPQETPSPRPLENSGVHEKLSQDITISSAGICKRLKRPKGKTKRHMGALEKGRASLFHYIKYLTPAL